jgi:hypothetical protein
VHQHGGALAESGAAIFPPTPFPHRTPFQFLKKKVIENSKHKIL